MSPAQRIERSAIVSAAFEILDTEGFDRLTMRAVAARLGVRAASLYYHVANRNDLLRLVAEQVAVDATAGLGEAGEWRVLCTDICTRLRATLRAHPGATHVVAVNEVSPEVFERIVPVVLSAFHDGLAISDTDALYLVQSLYVLVAGLALAEFGNAPQPPAAPRDYYDAWFQLSVDTMLDGIRARFAR
ncbi:TetR/AcrR family transcriptional regulator [Humibacter ginsenosidimutans]|uniref:TetR family transcriptional regulator n=1 Tax=Humibacter ginsenosidimutans TaxID=2599293 RepID=A0A5B8M1Q2_9MICO|nr:TetR family transcriptional regulator [Humibacter ginsenosidimutans]QDZ13755.1 TetR family transcriptional regulator [Humibacter ginsenosidimutans]